MNPSIRRLPATGTLGALLTLAATLSLPAPALAQKSLGAGSGSGPVMTREELRTCLKQQVALKERVELFERDTGSLEREKADILVAQKALDAERGGVVADANKISAVNARAADLSKRIDEWNERWQAFEKEGRTGPFADRQRRKLLDEQREMKAEEADLAAERDKLSGISGSSTELNAKVDSLNQRTAAWNTRNGQMAKRSDDLAQARDLWAAECGSRRYREDDEIAIKQGK
jgi:hypothetical protein